MDNDSKMKSNVVICVRRTLSGLYSRDRGLIKCKHFLEHQPIREERNGGGLGELLDWAATSENCLHFNRKLYVFMN